MDKINAIVVCVRMVNGDVIYSFENVIREEAVQRALSREGTFPIRFEDVITGESKLIPMNNVVSMYRVINFTELCHIRTELKKLISSMNYIDIDDSDELCKDTENENNNKHFVGKRFLRCTGTHARARLETLSDYVKWLSMELDKSE